MITQPKSPSRPKWKWKFQGTNDLWYVQLGQHEPTCNILKQKQKIYYNLKNELTSWERVDTSTYRPTQT